MLFMIYLPIWTYSYCERAMLGIAENRLDYLNCSLLTKRPSRYNSRVAPQNSELSQSNLICKSTPIHKILYCMTCKTSNQTWVNEAKKTTTVTIKLTLIHQKHNIKIWLVLTVYQPDSNIWPTSPYCYKATPLNPLSPSYNRKKLTAYLKKVPSKLSQSRTSQAE